MPELPWWFLALFVMGVNFAIWGTVGAIRFMEARAARLARRRIADGAPAGRPDGDGAGAVRRRRGLSVSDVAVLMPAHNEAAVIQASLDAIMKLVPASNIHVVSDGSTDDTPDIARRAGVHVYETPVNVGKAGALHAAIEHFELISRFEIVLLLDADTRVHPDYFTEALPLFDEPDVVAVAGCVRTARDRQVGLMGNILIGHRERIYSIGQRVLKFGQTYLRANATPIIPGFASMYRTEILPAIDVNPPGLVIEDFNMTFEVYQKRLGKVAFTLSAVAETQDPDRFRDYVRQTRRWAVGLWQTVRRHPPKMNLFTAMLSVLLIELITSSAIFVLLPMTLLVLSIPDLAPASLGWLPFDDVHTVVAAHMKLSAVLFGVVIPDYALTCVVAVLDRRPRLLLLGLFFPLMRVIDAAIALSSIPAGWLVRSNGTWRSPGRRSVTPQATRLAVGAVKPAVSVVQPAVSAGQPAVSVVQPGAEDGEDVTGRMASNPAIEVDGLPREADPWNPGESAVLAMGGRDDSDSSPLYVGKRGHASG